jgi:hypothetical protein
MEITNRQALDIMGIFQALDQAGAKFTANVNYKLTANRFELKDAIKNNEKYVELVKEEFAKSVGPDLKPLAKAVSEKNPCFDLRTIQHAPQEITEEFSEKFNAYLNSHIGYTEFLDKMIKVDFVKIYLKDLEKCDYIGTILWLLEDVILFKDKATVKPSAN